MKKRISIMLVVIFIIITSLGFYCHNKNLKQQKKESTLLDTTVEKLIIETKEEPIQIVEETLERTVTTMYVSANQGLNIREYTDMESNIIDTVPLNTELEVYDDFELDGWYMIKYNNNDYYVWGEYVSTELTEIPEPVHNEETSCNYNYTESYNNNATYSASDLRSMGLIYWNGWRWTWYSQNVLAGGGLDISGRHVDENGYVCDGEGYICLASSTLSKGTIVETPFGKCGKVYDSGCASDTLDVYTNF